MISLKWGENPIKMFKELFPPEIRLYTLLFAIHISRKTVFNQGRELGNESVNSSALFMLLCIFLMTWIVYKNRKDLYEAIKGTKALFSYYLICGISVIWAVKAAYSTFFPKFMEIFFSYLAICIVIYKIREKEKTVIYVLYLTTMATFLGIFKSFFSLYFHTNAYTVTAMIGVILSMGLLKYSDYRPASWFLIINVFCLIMGTSSGSYIAFIIAFIVFISTSEKGIPLFKILFVTVLAYFIYTVAETIIYSYVFYGHSQLAIEGGTGRFAVWDIYMKSWQKSPWLGYGFVVGERNLVLLGGKLNILSAHNGYLSVLIGTGIFGATFFLLFLIKTFWKIYNSTRNYRYAGLAATIFSAICGVCVNNASFPALGSDWYYTSTATISLFVLANIFHLKDDEINDEDDE